MERLMLVMWVVTGCSPRAPTGGGGGGGGGGGDSIPIAGHVLYVPAGFTVNIFAQNVGGVRFLALGPGGAVGSSCNVCDDPPPRAAVTRYNLDGSGAHTFATGLRNSVGLAFNPGSGQLWANNNDRDYLGDDLPPEHLNILQDGKWYGWPQCYLPNQPNPEYSGANCSNVEPPAL